MTDLCVPCGYKTVKNNRPKLYPREIIKLASKKQTLWKKCALFPSDVHLRWKYRECVNRYRNHCRRIVRQQEEHIINANNLGAFYRHVNQRIGHRDAIGPLIDSSNNVIVSDTAIADMFNKHFASVGVIDNGVTPRSTITKLSLIHI